jgi:hypothetical protein
MRLKKVRLPDASGSGLECMALKVERSEMPFLIEFEINGVVYRRPILDTPSAIEPRARGGSMTEFVCALKSKVKGIFRKR